MLLQFIILAATIVRFVIFNNMCQTFYVKSEIINSSVPFAMPDDFYEMLNTEKVLIDTLSHYIESHEQKLEFLKRKTVEIRNIHNGITDREKYLYNPINALIILKRFTADWQSLKSYAETYLQTDDFIKNYTQQMETLHFPSDKDCDAALVNLLRIQDMYQLEPQRLAVGEINGVKLGSKMTWNDCLDIGIQSSKKGFQNYAKYWMETALENFSNIDNTNNNNTNKSYNSSPTPIKQEDKILPTNDYTIKARLDIMKALLNTEYKLGNLKKSLKLANEMLKIQPKLKNLIKVKNRIKQELKEQSVNKNMDKNNKTNKKLKSKITKTLDMTMMEQTCREAINTHIYKQKHATVNTTSISGNPQISSTHTTPTCAIVTNNLPYLFLMPLKVEWLHLNPFIVIYHNILSDKQMEELKDFIVEKQDGTIEFTKIGRKRMRLLNEKLYYLVGHYGQELYDDWQLVRLHFENLMEFSMTTINYETDNRQTKLLFNLQKALMGGSIIFPQLKLSINLPPKSILYWSTNEHQTSPYRRLKWHMCPVIAGSQLTVTTSIKNM